MPPDTFVGLSEVDWVAFGSIATAATCLVAGLAYRRYVSPAKLIPEDHLPFTSLVHFPPPEPNKMWVRVPIRNTSKATSASQAQIQVTGLIEAASQMPVANFIPIRLVWTHLGKATYDTIPPKAMRCIDFGFFELDPCTSHHKMLLCGEVMAVTPPVLWPGKYLMEIEISGDGVKTAKYRIKLQLKDISGSASQPSDVELIFDILTV